MIRVGIITVSDKAWQGKREDRSGKLIKELVEGINAQVIEHEVVPDEREYIEEKLKTMADDLKVDLILTTGGTGLGPRDVTPEATAAVIHREVPGLAEAMRSWGRKSTPFAILSRSRSGIRNKTLIVNLPGSPRGVKESLEVILPALPHGIEILRGRARECALGGQKKRAG